MDEILSANVPENWKESIRDCFITAFTGTSKEKIKAASELGYAYQCYAPSSIFKYMPPIPERFEIVQNNKLWYSAPNKFNDVFDSDFPVDQNSLFKSILTQTPNNKGIRVGSPAWKHIRAEIPKITKQFRDTMDRVRRTTGVACFSESDNSLLMWSHYAHNHQGICVEYELLQFSTELNFSPVPVIYSKNRISLTTVNISAVEASTAPYFIGNLTTKSPEWSYENEWRIIRDSGSCGTAWNEEKCGALLPSITPASIILGCAFDESSKLGKNIYEYCWENSINLYKMEKDEAEYKLNKKTILQYKT